MDQPQVRGHLPALDGLRGAAILLVILTHAVGLPLDSSAVGADRVASAVARVGWIGVDLFFVLSGLLITGILLDTREEPGRWKRFFARRALRIFPLYYGVLALILVVPALISWSEPQYQVLRENQAWYWAYGVNFLNFLTRGDGTPLNTVHFWSLSIEEQFYIFWPFVVWACRPATLLRVAGVTFVVGLVVRTWLAVADPYAFPATSYLLTPLRLDGLMMGAVLAVYARRPGGLLELRPLAAGVVVAGTGLLLAFAMNRGSLLYTDPIISSIGFPLIAATFGALLVLVLTSGASSTEHRAPGTSPPVLQRFFSSRFLRSWGTYSYGIYVFHYLIIGALLWTLDLSQFRAPWLGGSMLPAVLAFALVVSALSWGVAWVSYHAYEKPFLSLKKYFDRAPRTYPLRPRLRFGRKRIRMEKVA